VSVIAEQGFGSPNFTRVIQPAFLELVVSFEKGRW